MQYSGFWILQSKFLSYPCCVDELLEAQLHRECRRRPFWHLSLHSCCRMCLAAQSLAVALGPCISSAHVRSALGSNKTSPVIACHKKLGLGGVKLDLLSNKRQIGINLMDLSLVAENLWSYLFECQKCKYWIKVEVKLKLSLVEVVCSLFCMLQAL